MSRNTILQLIAAAITIAIMIGIHQGLGWYLRQLDHQFVIGLAVGVTGTAIVFMILILADQRRLAALRRSEQQGARNVIDL